MFVPSQGFRHAAALLLTNSARGIPDDASPEMTRMLLERLAHELVALADDTRAPSGAADWLIAEFNATIDRLHQRFDCHAAKSAGAAILSRVASRTMDGASRDLFLIYIPEDRLPVAAPLAVELTKRRVSVAFAEFEVATGEEFAAAVARGLASHRGGVILRTRAFDRYQWPLPAENHRIRIVHDSELPSEAEDLAGWVKRLKLHA
jgi:hypothetical protein